ncbi:hypothetical protein F511_42808 [Dorcoceras hygrometricum]|uniref:Uncharacterized protein n=1 Tax=Dorcoceras hygrometricum TaxID=472368 RepID=A0A2Z7BFP1_9LAMI|nr:hypothetical protein F511_42808 [Dorcoceras hygrometricum]
MKIARGARPRTDATSAALPCAIVRRSWRNKFRHGLLAIDRSRSNQRPCLYAKDCARPVNVQSPRATATICAGSGQRSAIQRAKSCAGQPPIVRPTGTTSSGRARAIARG